MPSITWSEKYVVLPKILLNNPSSPVVSILIIEIGIIIEIKIKTPNVKTKIVFLLNPYFRNIVIANGTIRITASYLTIDAIEIKKIPTKVNLISLDIIQNNIIDVNKIKNGSVNPRNEFLIING